MCRRQDAKRKISEHPSEEGEGGDGIHRRRQTWDLGPGAVPQAERWWHCHLLNICSGEWRGVVALWVQCSTTAALMQMYWARALCILSSIKSDPWLY
jgi:hypothetical protein